MLEFKFWNINNSLRAKEEIVKYVNNAASPCVFGYCEYWDIKNNMKCSDKDIHDPIRGRIGLCLSNSIKIVKRVHFEHYNVFDLVADRKEIKLVIVHLRSQLRSETDAQSINMHICQLISNLLHDDSSNEHSVVMGDFNLPHYHKAFLDLYHLNVTNYLDIKESKKCGEIDRKKMYSPLVSLVGDNGGRVPSSYRYAVQTSSQSWQLFDQILLSYSLGKMVDPKSVKILDKINDKSLLTVNLNPNNRIFSDHLPITLRIS
jgi:hypothetical protein